MRYEFSDHMFKPKMNHYVHVILSFFLCIILVLSGCLNQELKEEETMIPSLQAQDLFTIQDQTLSWFNQHLNKSTGLLDNLLESLTLSDDILTIQVLLDYASENEIFASLLNQSFDTVIDHYLLQQNTSSLISQAQLLILLSSNPSYQNNQGLQDQLAISILSHQHQNNTFNTTPFLSRDAALALNALILYATETTNATIKTRVNDTIVSYYQIINEFLEHVDSSWINQQGYQLHSFITPFSTALFFNNSMFDWYQLISSMNKKLSDFQETYQNNTLGQYTSFGTDNPFLYQLQALESISLAYHLSNTLDQKNDESMFRQSYVLGLIYLKNSILENQIQPLTTEQNLSVLLVLKNALSELPQTNWTYLWDGSNQQLLEGRSLETSPTLWTVLIIGVMGSICLLALVFILVQLYYKNNRD